MQCFERQAMYLKLYADAIVEIPGFEFDADLLDEALGDFKIDRFDRLMALEDRKRVEIVNHLKSIRTADVGDQDHNVTKTSGIEVEESPDYSVPCSLLSPNSMLDRSVLS